MPQNTLAQVANLYDPKKKKLENYLKRATALQLNSITMDSKAHLKAVNLRDSLFHKSMKELIILQSIIKMSEIMPQQSHKKVSSDILKDIGCGRYNKEENGEYKYCYEYLMSDVQVYMEERKTIFIMFGMEEYCLIEGEKENFYSTHSTCLLLVPREKHYEGYYINSHGRDMADTTNFVRKITKKRTKTVSFTMPSEFVFIRDLIQEWNKSSEMKIVWDTTPRYTYYNTDLQAGDFWGICYAFPQIILHHMAEYYTKKKELTRGQGHTTVIDEGEVLLKKGRLDIFVKYAFTNFNNDYLRVFCETIDKTYKKSEDDPLNNILEKQRTDFVKSLVCTLVRYMNQKI